MRRRPRAAADRVPEAPDESRGGASRLRGIGVVAVCTMLALTAGLWLRPTPSRLAPESHGDQELAALVRARFGEDARALAIAAIDESGTRIATVGADADDRFEIGSISKGITGLLLEVAIERGEATPETPVGALVDLGASPVGEVTLGALATHTSGLPALIPSGKELARSVWWRISGASPYGTSLEEFLDDIGGAPLDSPPGTYSNIGFQLLGAALAEAAGIPYPQLLRERITGPLGMQGTFAPRSVDELEARDVQGDSAIGTADAPWVGEPIAPAGGVRSSIRDMAVLAEALLEGDAPGSGALRPRRIEDGQGTGWAWITSFDAEGDVVWHNGATGGFTSILALDHAAGRAVVVLAAGVTPIDAVGIGLVRDPEAWS